MKRTSLLAAGLGVVAALGLAGCSSSTTTTPTAAGTSLASTSSSPSSTAPTSAASNGASDGSATGATVDFSSVAAQSAAAAKAAGAVHVTTSLGGSVVSQGEVDYASMSQRQTVSVGGMSAEILIVDKKVYLGGSIAQSLKSPTKWVEIDPGGTDSLSQQMAPLLSKLSGSGGDPLASLSGVSDVKGTVTAKDASSTTYKVVFTKDQVAQIAKAGGLPSMSASALPSTGLTYEYTIDSKGLPEKIVVEVSGQSVTLGFSKWGESTAISAPAASDVTASSKLTGAA